jgi:hypothetical protein
MNPCTTNANKNTKNANPNKSVSFGGCGIRGLKRFRMIHAGRNNPNHTSRYLHQKTSRRQNRKKNNQEATIFVRMELMLSPAHYVLC